MPGSDSRIQAALAELQRRGLPMSNASMNAGSPAAAPAAAPAVSANDIAPVGESTGQLPPPDYSSPRDVERQLRLKQMKGQLAVQDAVNELKRRGINLQMKTQPATEEITTRAATEAVENSRAQGDPEAFKNAWRQLFPGRPLPRKDGQIDYAGGQDDLDVEVDRRKKLESAKVGVHNVSEHKVTKNDPTTGKDREYLVRTDKTTGQVLGETLLAENTKPLTEVQSNAKMFASRLASNDETIRGIESKGFEPAALSTTIQKFIPNRFRAEDFQSYNAAKQNWIAAVLRKESGAAISSKEYSDADKQYFAQDGDSKSVVQQKQNLRKQVEEQMRSASGPHAGTAAPAAPLNPSVAPAGAAAAPAPAANNAPVDVRSAAEAPPTAKFIRSPSGRVYVNPKYTGQ